MKRSSFNTRIHYRDAEMTSSTYQRPANDEGYIEFKTFSRRLSMKTKPYDPERIPSSHQFIYSTDSHVSTNQRPANDEGYIEYETFSRRLSKKTKPYYPESILSSQQLTYSPNNRVSAYQRHANDEGNFEYEALSERQSVITEHHDPEEIPFSHRWPYSINNHVSTNLRQANDEGNFEYEALAAKESIISERHNPEEIPSIHQLPYSSNNRVSIYHRSANEGNCEDEALSGGQYIITKPHDPEEISSHRWPYSTINRVSTYQRSANVEGDLEALSGRQSVITECHDSEEIPSSHWLPYLTKNCLSSNERPGNDEGNFQYEALSGRQSVKPEPHDPEKISTTHPCSTNNLVSTHQRPTNDESNFELETLSRRESVKSEPCDPEEISTSHPLPYLTNNHFYNNAENVVIPTVGPPPIMIKVSPKFEADLKLMVKKFGQISSKKVGIFFKVCPETYDLHRKLISFFETKNIQYKTPRKIRVFITGLPCHMSLQQIKDALTEKGFKVEEIIQVTEHHTKKPLPLFRIVLPNSDRNQNILYLTNLLNLNISVGSVRNGQLHRHYIKYSKKDMIKSGVPEWVNFIKTPETISWDGSEKYSCNNNFSGTETTCINTPRSKRRRNRRYFN